MMDRKTPASYSLGLVLLFIPSILGLLSIFEVLPHVRWVQITLTLAIIGCVAAGSYFVWGKRPRESRREWTPSETLPKSDTE